jgi:DNA-binding NarL/FixJ family response regulator
MSPELTAREREVMDALALGLSNKQICEDLGITAATCKSHLTAIFDKLDAHNRVRALRAAGYIEAPA